MITAVDTSVVLDILAASPHLAESRAKLERSLSQGKVVACPVVWAELRPFFPSRQETDRVMAKLQVEFDEIGPAGADLAGAIWASYRKAGGSRSRVIADFLIAAHAATRADQLLARDRGFLRKQFPDLRLA